KKSSIGDIQDHALAVDEQHSIHNNMKTDFIIRCGLGLTYRKYSEIMYRVYAEQPFLTLVKQLKFLSFS
ncbi:MAG: hypothetical protein SPC80_05440, partial [Prevotella sp.]|nr:hypothetical protein [Prevotella sp.]